MKLLIEHFPESAELLMDRCVQRSNKKSSNDPNFSVTYDFHLLDPGPDDPAFVHGRRFFGPSIMVKHERKKLLLHPLTQVLLNQKWSTFGRFIHYFNFLTYLIFVALYSALLIIERKKLNIATLYEENGKECYNVTNWYHDENETLHENVEKICFRYPLILSNELFPYTVLVFTVAHLAKEIMQIIIQRFRYFTEISNLLEWLIYGSAFLFTNQHYALERPDSPFLLLGVTSIFLCYANLVLFLRRLRLFGIYVTMFLEVTKTVIKVLLVFFVFIIGFAIVFYILFKDQVRYSTKREHFGHPAILQHGEMCAK